MAIVTSPILKWLNDVRPARLERATYGSGGRRSIQLSYGRGVVDYNGNELGAQLGDDAKAQMFSCARSRGLWAA